MSQLNQHQLNQHQSHPVKQRWGPGRRPRWEGCQSWPGGDSQCGDSQTLEHHQRGERDGWGPGPDVEGAEGTPELRFQLGPAPLSLESLPRVTSKPEVTHVVPLSWLAFPGLNPTDILLLWGAPAARDVGWAQPGRLHLRLCPCAVIPARAETPGLQQPEKVRIPLCSPPCSAHPPWFALPST